MRKLILAVGALVALAACGSEPPAPTEGVVTALPYGGEGFTYTNACGQWKDVPKVTTTTTGTGKNRKTKTKTTTERKCIQNVLVANRKPPWWEICIVNPGHGDHCMRVAEHVWRQYTVGSYYRIGA